MHANTDARCRRHRHRHPNSLLLLPIYPPAAPSLIVRFGLFYGGHGQVLLVQLIEVLAIFGWTGFMMGSFFFILNKASCGNVRCARYWLGVVMPHHHGPGLVPCLDGISLVVPCVRNLDTRLTLRKGCAPGLAAHSVTWRHVTHVPLVSTTAHVGIALVVLRSARMAPVFAAGWAAACAPAGGDGGSGCG